MEKNVSEVRMKRLFEMWSLIPKTLNPVGFVFVYMFSFLIIFGFRCTDESVHSFGWDAFILGLGMGGNPYSLSAGQVN